MIDIEKMHTSISKIRHIFGDDVRATQSLGEVFELITRLREAEKDAERYRYIKSVCEVIECTDGQYLDVLDGQDLDAMVDDCIEAMKEKGDE